MFKTNIKMNKFSIFATMIFSSSVVYANSQDSLIGLYNSKDFKTTTGKCADCAVPNSNLWYFENEIISVPKEKSRIASLKGNDAKEDVKNFYINNKRKVDNSLPATVWVGSVNTIEGKLNSNATKIVTKDGRIVDFEPIKKIDTNLSYYNEKSVDFFKDKEVIARGTLEGGKFIARSMWLKDFNINKNLNVTPLKNQKIIDLVRDKNISDNEMTTRVLWSKNGQEVSLGNKPVLAFILNGAQGDDDEAHGGHFAVATGIFGKNGEWNNWLVNNFYGLNSFSEKGITSSILPMDSYQADLNSGQSWYRPTYMLVAVMKDKKVPQLYQESINRVFNHFYRHDFEYNHALANCTGLNLETFRTLGWNIPQLGGESNLKAVAALPFITAKDQSLINGKKAFNYLNAEMTNLYPLVGFDTVGQDLLNKVVQNKATNEFEEKLIEDIEAIIYVKLPQLPSSRAFGSAPVASLDEYMKRVPEDKAKWKIIPVEPRPMPEILKSKNPVAWTKDYSDYVVVTYGLLLLIILILVVNKLKKMISKKIKD